MSEWVWDEITPCEVCRYCGQVKELHYQYGFWWVCPSSFGTSTVYEPVPQFNMVEIDKS